MSRFFSDTSGEGVDLGNVYSFDINAAWSTGMIHRLTDLASGDQRILISKYAGFGERQLLVEVSTADQMTAYMANALKITGSTLSAATWYLTVLTNSGTGGAGTLTLHTMELDGTVIDSAVTGDPQDETAQTNTVYLGRRSSAGNEYDGDQAHAFLIEGELTVNQINAFRVNPPKAFATWMGSIGGTSSFYLPLFGLTDPEPDWSGNGHTGAVTAVVRSDMPPVRMGGGNVLRFPVAAPAGGSVVGSLSLMGVGL